MRSSTRCRPAACASADRRGPALAACARSHTTRSTSIPQWPHPDQRQCGPVRIVAAALDSNAASHGTAADCPPLELEGRLAMAKVVGQPLARDRHRPWLARRSARGAGSPQRCRSRRYLAATDGDPIEVHRRTHGRLEVGAERTGSESENSSDSPASISRSEPATRIRTGRVWRGEEWTLTRWRPISMRRRCPR